MLKEWIKIILNIIGLRRFSTRNAISNFNKCIEEKMPASIDEVKMICRDVNHYSLLSSIKRLEGSKGLKEKDLNNLTSLSALLNNHDLYKSVLYKYDDKVSLKSGLVERFVGKGSGLNTLNTYRSLELNGEAKVFEKIYFKNSGCDQRSDLFYQQFYDEFKLQVNIPGLIEKNAGKFLVVKYYQYVEKGNGTLEAVSYYKYALSCYIALKKSRIDEKNRHLFLDFNTDHENNHIKHNLIADLTTKFKIGKELIDKAIKVQNNLPKQVVVYSHGDLHKDNITQDGYVLDWDTFGIFALGHDFGKILSFYLNYTEKDSSFDEKTLFWLDTKIVADLKLNLSNQDDQAEYINVLYYFFAYSVTGVYFKYSMKFPEILINHIANKMSIYK